MSQYFTAVVFDVSVEAAEGGRTLKLTFPNKPEASRIALASPEGDIFNPLDTSLDGRVFAGTKRRGVVAFEPFDKGIDYFEILLEGRSKKREPAATETLRVRVTSPTMREDMTTCLSQPSILEQMTKQFKEVETKHVADVRAKTQEIKKKAASGCLVVIALWLTAACAVTALAVRQFGWLLK